MVIELTWVGELMWCWQGLGTFMLVPCSSNFHTYRWAHSTCTFRGWIYHSRTQGKILRLCFGCTNLMDHSLFISNNCVGWVQIKQLKSSKYPIVNISETSWIPIHEIHQYILHDIAVGSQGIFAAVTEISFGGKTRGYHGICCYIQHQIFFL